MEIHSRILASMPTQSSSRFRGGSRPPRARSSELDSRTPHAARGRRGRAGRRRGAPQSGWNELRHLWIWLEVGEVHRAIPGRLAHRREDGVLGNAAQLQQHRVDGTAAHGLPAEGLGGALPPQAVPLPPDAGRASRAYRPLSWVAPQTSRSVCRARSGLFGRTARAKSHRGRTRKKTARGPLGWPLEQGSVEARTCRPT